MDIKEIMDDAQSGRVPEEEESYGLEQDEKSAWEENPQAETQEEPPRKTKRKLKPLIIIAVVLTLSAAGIIVFKKFVQTRPAPMSLKTVKTNVFQGEPSLLLKAESKAAPKVKTPVAGKADQTVSAALLAVKPVNTAAEPATVQIPSSALAEKRQVNKANNLNDLFKLKTAPKTPVKAVPQVNGESFPGQVPAPNFNGIPPNVLQNIKSKINGGLKSAVPSGPVVLGVSNNFAVVQYNGADLYLKSGDSFGSCTVLYIGYNNVKITCGKVAKSYPVEFGDNKEISK